MAYEETPDYESSSVNAEPKSSLDLVREGLLHLAALRTEGKLPERYHDVPEALAGRLAVVLATRRVVP